MTLSRRAFIRGAAASALVPAALRAQDADRLGGRLFRHGVASGDPLQDRVILWTRLTPPATRSAGLGAEALAKAAPIEVTWRITSDERLTQVVARGTASAAPDRDFTVKVDAAGLLPGRVYHYAFEAGGQQSPIGRTKTLAADGVERLRLAAVSCSNYPSGYFNVYRCLANRQDLDLVLHLGDYIYEFANGVFGDGSAAGRVPLGGEAVTLADYRLRYATYRTDPDLQDAHRLHPFVVVWDDHEIADNTWSGGALNHQPRQGSWPTRLNAAYRAYLEWLPIREAPGRAIQLYRSFRAGNLADIVMLDTRGLRDQQLLTNRNDPRLTNARRSLLGAKQEAWLFDQLRASKTRGAGWRVV